MVSSDSTNSFKTDMTKSLSESSFDQVKKKIKVRTKKVKSRNSGFGGGDEEEDDHHGCVKKYQTLIESQMSLFLKKKLTFKEKVCIGTILKKQADD